MEISVVSISTLVVTLNQVTKLISKDVFGKNINRFIPIFSIMYGIILGIVGYYTKLSNFGDSIFEAIFIGVTAGAAATGYHQVGKQLTKNDTDINLDDKDEELNEDTDVELEDISLEESEDESDETEDPSDSE